MITGTILVFWSLSGFILKLVQMKKSVYLKGTNMFVLKQINNKINTTVISMSVICLMLFMTISVLSSSLSLRNTMQNDLKEMTPVDINLYKTANLPEVIENRFGEKTYYTELQIEDSRKLISETLKNYGYDIKTLKDVVEIPTYAINELTMQNTLGDYFKIAKEQFSMLNYNSVETIVKISDYNKIARLYGISEYELKDDEYIVLCDFDSMIPIRNEALKLGTKINILGKEYKPKYSEVKFGYILMSTSHTNTGIILVPDNAPLTEECKEQYILAANYNAATEEKRNEIEKTFVDDENPSIRLMDENGIRLDGFTKITIQEASIGVAAIVVFIAIYLGIVFLITSAAILALKQLTESSDNRQRYVILRKIGCDESMINRALFAQIAIFFMLPLLLGIIHSIFGIQFAITIMSSLASSEELLPSIIATVIIISVIYGLYFLATYFESKNIIKDE